MTPSVEVSIAEIAKDIKYIIKRLEEGTVRFEVIEAQLADTKSISNASTARLLWSRSLCR